MSDLIIPADRGLSLLISQYASSTNLQTYIGIFLKQFEDLYQAEEDCNTKRYIDTAVGYQLDVLAEIVGTGRVIPGAGALGYYGHYEAPSALGMGDDNDENIGGVLRGEGQQVTGDLTLTDAQLRKVIRAKVIKNTTHCGTENVIDYIELVLGRTVDIEITNPTPASIDVNIHEYLVVNDRTLLAATIKEIKPAGVTMTLQDNSGVISLPATFMTLANSAYQQYKIGGILYGSKTSPW